MKEKAIIYGLGKCWDDYWQEIVNEYQIVCCIDRDPDKISCAKGFAFDNPQNISKYKYDKLIICSYRLGIREELILLWGIPTEKIFYSLELNQSYCTRPEQQIVPSNDKLTIVIPTYNRKRQLKRTLDILEKQSYKDFRVIILDNDSDYDVFGLLQDREKEFQNRIEIRKNDSNIGMIGNLAMSFLQVNDGWLWTLSDDDIPSVYAVEMIMQEISKKSNSGAFIFSISDIGSYMVENTHDIYSLRDLTEFYRKFGRIEELNLDGDFIFFSNKIYNIKYIKKYMEEIFTYSYTGVPQIIPILYMLDRHDAEVVISNRKIVTYALPEGKHWDWVKTALGMSTIVDIPLTYFNGEDRKVLYRLIMLRPDYLIAAVLKDVTYEGICALEKLYNNIYKIYLNDEENQKYLGALDGMKKLLYK